MAVPIEQLQQAVQEALDRQEAELSARRAAEIRAVVVFQATGTGHLNEVFLLDKPFRPVFVRCHFTGTSGTDAFKLSVDSASGSTYDVHLFTVNQAGVGQDVNLRMEAHEIAEPSPWILQGGDELRVEWTNPDVGQITWGLEVGLAPGS